VGSAWIGGELGSARVMCPSRVGDFAVAGLPAIKQLVEEICTVLLWRALWLLVSNQLDEMALTIIRTGRWLYGGSVEMPVDVIGLDYDWWFESSKGADMLEPEEKPMALGEQGLIYYARFKRAGETNEPTWVDSDGHTTPEQAMIAAESKAPTPIVWDQDSCV
jgi:hypothetical protein